MSMDPVLHSFRYANDFLREQVANVSERDLVALPPGLSNHPAWVVGHLTHSCELLGGVIGVKPWLPASYEKLFGAGSLPVADAQVYGPREAVLTQVLVGHTSHHVGQVGVWRKAMRLPPMRRGFE